MMYPNSARNHDCLFGLCVGVLTVCSALIQAPTYNKDFDDIHGWKNIRHYQFAQGMLETKNFFYGYSTFTQPETLPSWANCHTEAPWVDWLLVASMAAFGQSITVFRCTFIAIHLLSIVILAYFFKRAFGPSIGILCAAFYATCPSISAFASYSIGENFMDVGYLALAYAGYLLLVRPSKANFALFLLACLFLSFCKFTTGILYATALYAFVAYSLIFHCKLFSRPWFVKRKALSIGIAFVFVALPLSCAAVYAILVNKVLLLGTFNFMHAEFYRTHALRWPYLLGFPAIIAFCIALYYAIELSAKRLVLRQKMPTLDFMAYASFAAMLYQFFWQARATQAHEYYSNTVVVPSLLMTAGFLKARFARAPRLSSALVAILLLGTLYSTRSNFKSFSYITGIKSIQQSDIATIKDFFARRPSPESGKKFILSNIPLYGYFSDTNILLRYSMESVADSLLKTNTRSMDLLRRLGIKFAVLPIDMFPEETRQNLAHSTLIDFGPEYLKLGVVQTGEDILVLKICEGIARKEIILDTWEKGSLESNWIRYGNVFQSGEQKDENGTFVQSGDAEHGFIASKPFLANSNCISGAIRGGQEDKSRIELMRNGRIHHSCTATDKEKTFVFDTQPFWNSDICLLASDEYAWEKHFVRLGPLYAITYIDTVYERYAKGYSETKVSEAERFLFENGLEMRDIRLGEHSIELVISAHRAVEQNYKIFLHVFEPGEESDAQMAGRFDFYPSTPTSQMRSGSPVECYTSFDGRIRDGSIVKIGFFDETDPAWPRLRLKDGGTEVIIEVPESAPPKKTP